MENNDLVFIKNLSARGIIGIHPWERQEKQEILINAQLFGDLRTAGKTDSIEDTINYQVVAQKILTYIESSHPFTVEALAENLVTLCLEQPNVRSVRLRVEKPGAVPFAASVGIEIERNRSEPHQGDSGE